MIIQYPDDRLRQISSPANDRDEAKFVVETLQKTLRKSGGVALSAVQIGTPLRIAVFGPEITDDQGRFVPHMLNPVILTTAKKSKRREGCLSFRNYFIDVIANVDVTAQWETLSGEQKTARFMGLSAQAVSHEIDHMDGRLMIDREVKP